MSNNRRSENEKVLEIERKELEDKIKKHIELQSKQIQALMVAINKMHSMISMSAVAPIFQRKNVRIRNIAQKIEASKDFVDLKQATAELDTV